MPIWLKNSIEIIFSLGLFINAMLFIPQAYKLMRLKDAKDLSLLTFGGFNLLQFFIILHGLVMHDYILMIGYFFSLLTCGSVTVLIIWYRRRAKKRDSAVIVSD